MGSQGTSTINPPHARIIIGDSRAIPELEDSSISLIVTSPPYWHIKDYGTEDQIGYGQSLHNYLRDLFHVWRECFRVLKPGRRICINIGDQFARASVFGRYKVIPIHAEIIVQCEEIGFDFLGSIIWQKKTTMNTSGGATIMGSYPHPPNGILEIDYEYILIFKKPGRTEKVPREIKDRSALTKEEWKEYFSGHWNFGGAKQIGHEAMFPEELPKRLIRMFSFVGETVLDPFLGSGTTAKVALELGRGAVGYEVNGEFLSIIKEKIGETRCDVINIIERDRETVIMSSDYVPGIQNASPPAEGLTGNDRGENFPRVVGIVNENTILLEDGRRIGFLGVKVMRKEGTIAYLNERVLKRQVILKFNEGSSADGDGPQKAYVYLKNKIFINSYLIKSGLAVPDPTRNHPLKKKFQKISRTLN